MRRPKQLEEENVRLKRLVADLSLDGRNRYLLRRRPGSAA
jgi:hypothetical protein